MIARKSLFIVISHFLIQFIGWIGIVVLAKLWGSYAPEALGIIGFAMSFLALFNIVADLGFGSAHVKRISEGKDLGTCIGTFATIKICLTGLMVTLVFVFIFIWKNILQRDFYDTTTESIIFVFIAYYIFSNLFFIPLYTFTGTREVAKLKIPSILGRMFKVPLAIIVTLAGVSTLGTTMNIAPAINWPQFLQPLQQFFAAHAVGSLALTYVIDMAVVFFVGMWFLRKYPIKKPSLVFFKSYFSFALPIMLITIIELISTNIDKVMIGYYWTSIEVGYYFSVQQILQFIFILSGAVGIVLFPTISKYHSLQNMSMVRKTTRLAERYISMVVVPVVVFIIVFAKPIINVMLSSAFSPATPVLISLTIYAFVLGLNMPFISLVSGINRPGIAAKIGFAICGTNIFLNYLFVPKDGLLSAFNINGPTGAATATLISALVGFFGLRFAAKRLIGMKFIQTHTPRHVIAGLIAAVVLLLFNSIFLVSRWYHLMVFAGACLLIYLGILYILKEFNKRDLKFFLDILQPKKMLKYISSELKD